MVQRKGTLCAKNKLSAYYSKDECLTGLEDTK